jgi:hypothetical protein
MPRIDFTTIEDVDSYSPIPASRYRCELADIEESATRNGDELWKLRFIVTEGEHADRCVFDNMVFSQRAYPRVKLICSRLGLDVNEAVDLTPQMLVGRACILSVDVEEYEDASGAMRKRNVVPYNGYGRDGGGAGGADRDADGAPF